MISAFLRPHAARVAALGLLGLVYALTQLPSLDEGERQRLASQFSFARLALPRLPRETERSRYTVNPTLERINAFISGAGVGIALNDLDGDGLPNDLCYVEPRDQRVLVAPVPGTGDRYPPGALDPGPALFDPVGMEPMGCLPGDLNEDGRMDLIVHYGGRPPIAFLRYQGGYVPYELTSHRDRWYTSSGVLADLDGDGHADLVFGDYYQDNARIFDPTEATDERMPKTNSRAVNGGRNHVLRWSGLQPGDPPKPLYVEQELAIPDELLTGWTIAVGAADLDGDLLPELYFANDFGSDRLLHNRSAKGRLAFANLVGARDFYTPTSKRVGKDTFKGMGVEFADLNRDGRLDFFVSNIAQPFAFVEGHFAFVSTGSTEDFARGLAPYRDLGDELGLARSSWGWDIKLGDFNNDGRLEEIQATGFIKGDTDRWPELHEYAIGNDETSSLPAVWPRFAQGDDLSGHAHNPFFVQDPTGYFYDIAPQLGLGDPFLGRGVATADVDGDGDLDFAFANIWEDSFFFRNDCPDCGAFLGLRLLRPVASSRARGVELLAGRPPVPGSPAIGATAEITLSDGQSWVAEVDGGNGFAGRRSSNLHFGLGKEMADLPVRIKVRWRDRTGEPREYRVELQPGWYTLILGDASNT